MGRRLDSPGRSHPKEFRLWRGGALALTARFCGLSSLPDLISAGDPGMNTCCSWWVCMSIWRRMSRREACPQGTCTAPLRWTMCPPHSCARFCLPKLPGQCTVCVCIRVCMCICVYVRVNIRTHGRYECILTCMNVCIYRSTTRAIQFAAESHWIRQGRCITKGMKLSSTRNCTHAVSSRSWFFALLRVHTHASLSLSLFLWCTRYRSVKHACRWRAGSTHVGSTTECPFTLSVESKLALQTKDMHSLVAGHVHMHVFGSTSMYVWTCVYTYICEYRCVKNKSVSEGKVYVHTSTHLCMLLGLFMCMSSTVKHHQMLISFVCTSTKKYFLHHTITHTHTHTHTHTQIPKDSQPSRNHRSWCHRGAPKTNCRASNRGEWLYCCSCTWHPQAAIQCVCVCVCVWRRVYMYTWSWHSFRMQYIYIYIYIYIRTQVRIAWIPLWKLTTKQMNPMKRNSHLCCARVYV
jgi:hypothetical protein